MRRSVLALFLTLAISATTLAQEVDPPARVARLSLIAGAVSLQPEGDGAPETAELNRPLTWGDRLLTEGNSRAEMSVGTAAIRLDQNTDLSIANLDADIVQVELNSGVLGIHVRELGDAEIFEIDTPNAAIVLRGPGDYRVEVDAQNATVLAVRTGEAELDGGAGPILVADRQELRFTGAEQLADVQLLGPLTAFDEWCIERERTLAARESTRYVSREVVGYEDLDRHGIWWNEPGYGHVWAPTYVSIGWAPYRFGHWAWIGPWGYTWVDRAPWGYAPFHYGRWAYVRHRWCWVPGPRHVRPIWAPALVGWHGMPGVRDPSRPGSVSWFPLAPREVYVPAHRATPRYVRAVNISNTHVDSNSQITNAWRGRLREPGHANRNVPGAMSSLPAAAFASDRLRVGSVRPVNSGANAAPVPHLSTVHSASGNANAWRDTLNTRRAGVAREPQAASRAREVEPRAVDPRRTVPRVPTDRRALHSTSSQSGTAADTSKFRRPEQPPKHLSEVQRARSANAWQVPRVPRDSRAPTRTASPEPGRSDRGGTARAGGRDERSVRGNADSRTSGSRAQPNRGGESRMSGSHSQSSRTGAQSSGSGGQARMSGSSGSRSGRSGSVSARP